MINSLGTEKVGNKITKMQNVFSKHFVNFLYQDCKYHLKFNISKDKRQKPLKDRDVLVSNNIVDCHGLRILEQEEIKKDLIFPYSIRNWNIFCLKMQSIMFGYCDKFDIDKSQLVPHSCWVEGSSISKYKLSFKKINLLEDTDELLNSWLSVDGLTHYRIVYFLKTIDSEKYGLRVDYKNRIFTLPAEENTLYIIPTNDNVCYAQYPTDTEENITLMFNWYLHPDESENFPAWEFPNNYNPKILGEYIRQSIEKKNLHNSLQKTLYKHYLLKFQQELKKKLA